MPARRTTFGPVFLIQYAWCYPTCLPAICLKPMRQSQSSWHRSVLFALEPTVGCSHQLMVVCEAGRCAPN